MAIAMSEEFLQKMGKLDDALVRFIERQRECEARLLAAEEDVIRLGGALNGAMQQMNDAFRSLTQSELKQSSPAMDAVVAAAQFQDIGGQWISHLGAHLKRTRELLPGLGEPSDIPHVSRGAEPSHPIGLAASGSIELF
jgi:hypothetical protein